jgi:hypothetical protein
MKSSIDLSLLAALIVATALPAGIAAGALGRARRWSLDQLTKWTGGALVAVALVWWSISHWALHMAGPVDWLGSYAGFSARPFGFIAWLLASRWLAIQVARKIQTSTKELLPIRS